MIIKSFVADSAKDAMKQAREALGREAIVLQTREAGAGRLGSRIEITACIDGDVVSQPNRLTQLTPGDEMTIPGRSRRTTTPGIDESVSADVSRLYAAMDNLYDRLLAADLPQPVINHVMSCVVGECSKADSVEPSAHGSLERFLSYVTVSEIRFKPGDRVVFVGPAGSGKSSALGKLAAALVTRHKQKVVLSALDYSRVGAHEELAGYADLLQVKLSDHNADLNKEYGANGSIALIDGPSLPVEGGRLALLREKLTKAKPTCCLAVVSALIRREDVVNYCRLMRSLQPTHLIVTMLDQTARLGAAVAAALTLDVPLAFVSGSPGGMGELAPADPANLAGKLLSVEADHE
ncbi:MAG: hypothetical protein AB1744_08525 [Candidatus Zixiibacteriota bacterium]